MGIYAQVFVWVLVVCAFWTRSCVHGKPVEKSVGMKKVVKSCADTIQPDVPQGSNKTNVVTGSLCDPGDTPPMKITPAKLPVTVATKQEIITNEHSLEIDGTESSYTVNPLRAVPKKENLSGGKTEPNSDELLRSEFEEEEEIVDSLAPRPPYPVPEMGSDGGAPATTEVPRLQPGQDIAANNRFPNEKKSELFIDSGIFPFIAMGVLSALFMMMMIAALYFARHSSDVQHGQISMKCVGIGATPGSRDGTAAFNTVTFRNAEDAVMGDFAVNMFAVRQDEREESHREFTDATESTLVATPANTVPKVTTECPLREAERTISTLLDRDLPDVVSSPSSRRETMSNNRHSTGSSLYMDLMNMCRNTRLLEELALRRKNIRMQDASQLDQDYTFPDLSDSDCNRGKLVLMRQASLDSTRCRENVPLPCTYESRYYKVYDGDDDDSSALAASTSVNTTLDTVMFSSDEGCCSSTLSSLHRKGSSKRSSRLMDESRLLLPVQEFFNEAMIDSSDGGDVLYETIDEMGYRRRTASSRVIRRLMAARESAGHAGETVVVENAWETAPKKYDKIDRSIKAYKKQVSKDTDYNTLVV